jgi:diacylglycerol kinase (ATP)
MPATIALFAHERYRNDLLTLIRQYQPVFSRYRLLAAQQSGEMIQNQTNLPVDLLLPEGMGGEVSMAAAVALGEVVSAICLLDPVLPRTYEPAVQALLQSCDLANIPIATNLATAQVLVEGLARSQVAHLIFNPVAGQGNAEQELALIQRLLEPHFHLVVHQTTLEASAEELTRQAVAANADVVIASGGDGTISAVAGCLIGTGIPLGVLPRGTANAFASALGIPSAITPIRSACQVILGGKTRMVDVGLCNGIPTILLIGIGLEAEVVERADREAKDRWGALAYIMAGWQQLDEQELFDTELEIDGQIERFQAGAITIANAAPATSVLAQGDGQVVFDDGYFDITIASAGTKLEALRTVTQLLGAALMPVERSTVANPNVAHLLGRKITVRTEPPQKVVVDGEVIGTTPIQVECIPAGLTVFVP